MNALLTAFDGWQSILDAPAWVLLSLKMTTILLAAWLVHLALARTNPRWRVLLWRVTAVGLIGLPTISWLLPTLKIHVQQLPPAKEAAAVAAVSPTLPSPIGRGAGGEDGVFLDSRSPEDFPSPMEIGTKGEGGRGRETKQRENGISQPIAHTQSETTPQSNALTLTLSQRERGHLLTASNTAWLLLPLWFGGIGVLAFRLLLGHCLIWRMARGAKQPTPWVRNECHRVAEAVGCRSRVLVLQSEEVESPFLCGLRRPLLLLPARMCEASYRKDLPGILAHELTHARSHDVLWNLGLQVISVFLWFHPLVWRMRKAHLASCELVCDAVSASYVGDVAVYCRTLARVAVDACGSLPAAGIAMARTSAITRRLSLLRERVFHLPLRRRSVLAFGVAALLAVTLIGAIQIAIAEPPTETLHEIPAVLNKPEPKSVKKESKPAGSRDSTPKDDSVRISAVDEKGKPIPGAAVKIEGHGKTLVAESITLKTPAGIDATASGALIVEDTKKNQAGPKPDSVKSSKPGFHPMKIQVLDSDRKPIPNAALTIQCKASLPFEPIRCPTDAAGAATIEVPNKDIKDFQIVVLAKGYSKAGADWSGNAVAAAIPKSFTFHLESGTDFAGIIRDEQGKPIAGAEVAVRGWKKIPDDPLWVSIEETAKTDAEGKWRVHRIPKDLAGFDLGVNVKRPDVAGVERFEGEKLPIDKLRDQTAVFVVRKGIVVEGTVTDPQGKPVKAATVGLYTERSGSDCPRTKTDENGRYRIAANEPGQYTVAAVADGLVPDWKPITVGKDPRAVDLRLGKGEKIRLRVVDQVGKPLSGVVISTVFNCNMNNWRVLWLDSESARQNEPAYHSPTDAEGRWSRLWIPKDQIQFCIEKEGYVTTYKSFAPDEREQVIALEAGVWSISGRVVDSKTKAPVTKFHVTDGFFNGDDDPIYWSKNRPVENENGEYSISWNIQDERRFILIEADGYYSSRPSPRAGQKPTQTIYNVELNKGEDIAGVVLSPDGKPLANADVVLCTPERGLYLKNGRPDLGQRPLIVRTASDGRFSFPPEKGPFRLVAMHDRGFAEVIDQADMKQVTLQPWARVEGTLSIKNKPGVKEHIWIDFGNLWRLDPNALSPQDDSVRRICIDYQAETDDKGHYVLDRVPPGKAKINLIPKDRVSSWNGTNNQSVEFVPGKTLKVDIHADSANSDGRADEK